MGGLQVLLRAKWLYLTNVAIYVVASTRWPHARPFGKAVSSTLFLQAPCAATMQMRHRELL